MKSINDILRQADRIREGYGWKARRARWDYDRFMQISRKVNDIAMNYIRNIGSYQRANEGMTKEYQEREWPTIAKIKYNRNAYMNK